MKKTVNYKRALLDIQMAMKLIAHAQECVPVETISWRDLDATWNELEELSRVIVLEQGIGAKS